MNAAFSSEHRMSHLERIKVLDFSPLRAKLCDSDEGEGWSEEFCKSVELEYRRFLLLTLLHPAETIVPNRMVDTFWHYHILDTRAYAADCQRVLGRFLHHDPRFGFGSKQARAGLHAAFQRTQDLYRQEFGEEDDRSAVVSTCSPSSCVTDVAA
jgi:hypothetical protein